MLPATGPGDVWQSYATQFCSICYCSVTYQSLHAINPRTSTHLVVTIEQTYIISGIYLSLTSAASSMSLLQLELPSGFTSKYYFTPYVKKNTYISNLEQGVKSMWDEVYILSNGRCFFKRRNINPKHYNNICTPRYPPMFHRLCFASSNCCLKTRKSITSGISWYLYKSKII